MVKSSNLGTKSLKLRALVHTVLQLTECKNRYELQSTKGDKILSKESSIIH